MYRIYEIIKAYNIQKEIKKQRNVHLESYHLKFPERCGM